MKFYKHVILILAVVGLVTFACERDDICPESTATTPKVILRFYDIDATGEDELKQVRELQIFGINEDGSALEQPVELVENVLRASLDSISLPLDFDGEGLALSSKFEFWLNADLAYDDDDSTEPNIDIVTINYTPEFQYVSRACGYKSIFELQPGNEIRVEIGNQDLWIKRTEVVTTTIDNETSVHINIFH